MGIVHRTNSDIIYIQNFNIFTVFTVVYLLLSAILSNALKFQVNWSYLPYIVTFFNIMNLSYFLKCNLTDE